MEEVGIFADHDWRDEIMKPYLVSEIEIVLRALSDYNLNAEYHTPDMRAPHNLQDLENDYLDNNTKNPIIDFITYLEEKTDFIVALADRKKAREERVGGVVELDWLTKKGAKYRIGSILKILEGSIHNNLLKVEDGKYVLNESKLEKLTKGVKPKPKQKKTQDDIIQNQIKRFSEKIDENNSNAIDLRVKEKPKPDIKPKTTPDGIKISSIKSTKKNDDFSKELKKKPSDQSIKKPEKSKETKKSDTKISMDDTSFSPSPLKVPKNINAEENIPITYKTFNEYIKNFSSEIKKTLSNFKESLLKKIENIQSKGTGDNINSSEIKLGVTKLENENVEIKNSLKRIQNKIEAVEADYKSKTQELSKIAAVLHDALEKKLKHL